MSSQKDRVLEQVFSIRKSLMNQVLPAAERIWTLQFHSQQKHRSLHLRKLHYVAGLALSFRKTSELWANMQYTVFFAVEHACQYSALLGFHKCNFILSQVILLGTFHFPCIAQDVSCCASVVAWSVSTATWVLIIWSLSSPKMSVRQLESFLSLLRLVLSACFVCQGESQHK